MLRTDDALDAKKAKPVLPLVGYRDLFFITERPRDAHGPSILFLSSY